jgi:hypothetical protein
MRRAGLALVAIVAFGGVGAPVAEAGVTCKVVPSWCPSNDDEKHKGSTVRVGDSSGGSKQTPVPEPGSLMLLAAGVSAVGGAALRRRRRKKD